MNVHTQSVSITDEEQAPVVAEMVQVISGRTLHKKQMDVLNHPMYEPQDGRIYLFIDPDKANVVACNKQIRSLFTTSGLGAVPFPIFTYRGVCMLVLPESENWDYPIALFSHFVISNLDKFIAIRGVRFLADRLAQRKLKDVLPPHYQSLYNLSYNKDDQRLLNQNDQNEPQDYDVALREWKPVDIKHQELKDLLKQYRKLS